MMVEENEKIIRLVQSSTRNILSHYLERGELLKECSEDVKLLIREGHDPEIAQKTAKRLFGTEDNISFLAIDGTMSQDETFEMVIFYAGAFGYISKLNFDDKTGCICNEPLAVKGTLSMSTAIPIHEENISIIAGQLNEGGINVDAKRIPIGLMQLAEYYMAVKALSENPDIKVGIFDRMPSINLPSLISRVEELLDPDADYNRRSVLEGLQTEYGIISLLDLELARMLHPNDRLEIPCARSQLIRYAAINQLIKEQSKKNDTAGGETQKGKGVRKEKGKSYETKSYDDLLIKIGAKKDRLDKLKRDLSMFDQKYSLFGRHDKNKEDLQNTNIDTLSQLSPNIENYWQRVLSASKNVAEHIFNTPDNQYPLFYQNMVHVRDSKSEDNSDSSKKGKKQWITANDIDYLILVMIYALLRIAWEKNILVLGLVKDIGAADMIKSVIPLLQNSGNLAFKRELPKFNSDKMLLQTASIINAESTSAPWRTFEYDASFKTVVPSNSNDNDNDMKSGETEEQQRLTSRGQDLQTDNNNEDDTTKQNDRQTKVKGAFKNLIAGDQVADKINRLN